MIASSLTVPTRRIAGVLLLVALWEVNAYFALYEHLAPTLPPAFFPSTTAILATVVAVLSSSSYYSALLVTVSRTIAAFAVAATAAVLLALAAARSSILDDLLHYPTEFLRQLPAVAVIPFAIILFGIDSPMKIAIAVFGSFFPIFVGARHGLKTVEPGLMLTARMYGWSGAQLLFGVMLPSAVPQILATLRIALAIALILVIISEMLVGGDGLGVRIVERERTFDFRGLYADTLLLGVVGVFLNNAFTTISRRVYYWHEEQSWEPLPDAATAVAADSAA